MLNIDDRILEKCDESELFFMLHVAKHMGTNDFAFPSNETLCKAMDWEIKKLQRVKNRCIDKGFIERVERYKEGFQLTNGYKVTSSFIGVYINLKGKGEQGTPKWDNRIPQNGIGRVPQNGTTEVLDSFINISSSKAAEKFDFRHKENFTLTYKIPQSKYDEYLAAWISDSEAKGETYEGLKEALRHFYNFSSIRYKIENSQKAPAPGQRPGTGAEPAGAAYRPFPNYD
jgi:hypothetical protein